MFFLVEVLICGPVEIVRLHIRFFHPINFHLFESFSIVLVVDAEEKLPSMSNSIFQRSFLLVLSLLYFSLANPAWFSPESSFSRRRLFSQSTSHDRFCHLISLASSPTVSTTAASDHPNITHLTAQFFKRYKSERVVIKYGPFSTLPSITNNGMDTYEVLNAPQPCTDCIITYIAADLEYTDGTHANTDMGMWLHHTLLYSMKEKDAVCPQDYPARIFATGNERTPADISVNGYVCLSYIQPHIILPAPLILEQIRIAIVSINLEPKKIDNPHRTKESGIYVPANATWLLAL
jgi:hypothetical protein